MAVELGVGYVNLVPTAKGFVDKIKGELGGPLEQTGADAGDKAGSGFLGAFSGHMKAVAGLAAGALGGIGVGAGLLKIGDSFDSAFDSIRVGTGATGTALEGLQEDFRAVVANVPTDFGSASTAISDLNTRLGLTGKPLSDISAQVLNLSRLTDTDLGTNVESVTRLFGDWGISADDMSGKLDEMFRASQATGPSVDTLAQLMTQFGGPMRQLGFSFEETAGLLGKFEKEGVNTNLVMGSMRIALGKMAQAGEKDVPGALRASVKAIQEAGSAGEANSKALELFGAKAGPDMAAAIREGRFNIDELVDTISNGSETINSASDDTSDFAERWQLFKNRVMLALEPLASKVFGALGAAMDKIGPIAETVFSKLGSALSGVSTLIAPFFQTLKTGFTKDEGTPIENFALTVREAFGKIIDVGGRVVDTLKGIDWAGVFSTAVQFITPVVDAVFSLGKALGGFLLKYWTALAKLVIDNRATLLSVASVIRDVLATAVRVAADVFRFLGDHMGAVKAVMVPLLAGLLAFKAVTGVIKGVQLATKAWAAVQAAFNAVMAANPVVLVVVAIAALAAGVIYAYTHFKTFRDIVDTVGRVFKKVGETIYDAAVTVFNWLKDNWPLLLPILLGPIGIVAALIITFWDQIKGAATAAVKWVGDRIGDLVDFFTSLPGKIGGAVAGAASWLVQTGTDIVTGLWNGIQSLWGTVVGFFTGIASAVVGWVAGAASWLVQTGVDIITGLVTGYLSIWGEVIDFFTSIGGKVIGWLADAGSWLIEKGSDIIGGALVGLGQKERDLASYIGGLAAKVLGWIGNAASWLVGKGIDIIAGLLNGIYQKEVDLIRALGGLAGSVAGAVSDAASWLYEAGKDVIRGLINGIKDMVGSAVSAVVDAGHSIIDGAKGILGIGSPSKVFAELGRFTMQGFAQGLQQGMGGVAAQLAGVTDMVSGTGGTIAVNGTARVAPVRAAPAALPVAAGAGAQGQTIVVDMSNANVWGDVKSAARQINEELRKLQRSTG